MATKAWHLRQDGKAFPVMVHMYCMGDDDLSSEAEVASFMISTNSKDTKITEYVLDAWMALLIEQDVSYDADEAAIDKAILSNLNSLPYKFPYPLNNDELLSIHKRLNNYSDIDTLYDFTDLVREELSTIQEQIKKSFNQQFCRVRYGGQYNSVAGNNEIWFRISSEGYNWANTIYLFADSIKRSYKLTHITICRDHESDYGDEVGYHKEYFYKAKDGTLYKNMPIDEFFREEHEHSLVFENTSICEGVLYTIWGLLQQGMTYAGAIGEMSRQGIEVQRDLRGYYLRKEKSMYCKEIPIKVTLPDRTREGSLYVHGR